MPYKSRAQRGYFHAHKKELEAQGVNISEWDAASKNKKLPEKVKAKPEKVHPLREADFRSKAKKAK